MKSLYVYAAIAAVACAGTAMAQQLSGADATALVKGKTAYLELPGGPRGKGPAVIFYGDDNKSAAKFPNGTAPKGTWSAKGDEICTAWDDQPTNPCSRYVKVGDKYDLINVETKQVRATIQRLAPGNPEKL